MIFTAQQAQQQLSNLLIKYPELIVTEMNDSFICLCGKILVHRKIHEFSLHQIYEIEIYIPLNSYVCIEENEDLYETFLVNDYKYKVEYVQNSENVVNYFDSLTTR